MSAGRDVERLISDWLADEAIDRSRGRVLRGVRQAVEAMPQRRFGAAWREPVYLSPFRTTTLAAAFVVALIGAGLVGRMSASPGAGGPVTPTPTAAPSAPTVSIDTYRTARNAICTRFVDSVNPLKDELDGIFDPETPTADRSAKQQTLLEIVSQLEAMIVELAALEAPPSIADGHAAYVTRYRDQTMLIREILSRLVAGDLPGAESVDRATNQLNTAMAAFEIDNRLAACP